MTVLCPCGCGLAARNAEGDPHPGHELAAKDLALALHKAATRAARERGPRPNGTLDRRRRARERKARGEE